jgi:Tol biopolymer transport system component
MRRRYGRYFWLAAALTALIIGCAALFAKFSSTWRPAGWSISESHMPFIFTPLIERFPAISPDGTMIAYSAGPTINNRHIFLRLIRGGDPIQLTHDADDASAPAWSPDGRTLAYVVAKSGHPCRIMEIVVPAGQPRHVGQCQFAERSDIGFDAAGQSIFYSDSHTLAASPQVMKLDLQSGKVSEISNPPQTAEDDFGPMISPDGESLLYGRELHFSSNEIHVLSLSRRTDRLFATFHDEGDSAAWSSDGSTIFIARAEGKNNNSLWAYPAHGGEPVRILATGTYLGRLSSGPGALLAAEMQYNTGQLVAAIPHSNLPPTPLDTNGGLNTWCVDYAPDGTMLATGSRSDSFGVWISGADGALHQLIPMPNGAACAIRWSPDSTRFAYIYAAANMNGFDVPIMARNGTPLARFHFMAKEASLLDWTADGKSILTSRQEQQGWRIWRTDLATPHKSIPVTPFGWLDPRVHGRMLFAEKQGAPGIWRIDGVPRRITDGPAPDSFVIANGRLIYTDTSDPDDPTFSAQSIEGGAKDRLAPLPNGQMDFTFGVDPGSGAIVYSREQPAADIGMIRLQRQ